MNKRRKVTAGCILFAAGFALLIIARISQGFARWYSTEVYPVWVNVLGRLTGGVRYSLAEILLYCLIIGIIETGGRLLLKRLQKKEVRAQAVSWGWNLFVMAAVLFFLYVMNCGINYHRESFSESTGIAVQEYSKEDLQEVCQWLTEEVNLLSDAVGRDEDGVMLLDPHAGENAVKALRSLGNQYSEMAGYYPNPKGLIFPWILSVQNLTGIYAPFTIEANYNSALVDYNIPFTMCHELSHLRGYMQEEETNFIAFLACRTSEDVSFQYSGYLLGWVYCMNVLYKADYDAWEEVRGRLFPAVEADLQANREFWAQYDGAVAEVSNKINDTYLKANGQDDGVKSYDRMVDLIVTYYKEGYYGKDKNVMR